MTRPAAARRATLLALLLLGLTASLAGQAVPRDEAPGRQVVRLDVPLEDGRLDVRDLLEGLADALGVDAGRHVEDLDWTIDVETSLGRIQLLVLDRLTGGVLRTRVHEDHIEVRFDRARWDERVDTAETTLGAWFADVIGKLRAPTQRHLGLVFVVPGRPRVPPAEFAAGGGLPPRIVLLVHGLDDPGWMWRDLIPRLHAQGHVVARFDYPNDGPIADAADLLALALSELRAGGVERVDVVAHSMGGLVARDVLTRRVYYDGDGRGGERYPAIDRLVMLGTPNHGSAMARLRGISELQEHLSRLLSDDGGWLGALADGAGEAGTDLLPGSDFLRRLNARPLAEHTAYAIVAARISPVGEDEASDVMDRIAQVAESEDAPQWLRDWFGGRNGKAVRAVLTSAVRGLGDGCVTLDSARLDGVDDFVVVPGNHLSMLVDVLGTGDEPTSIPVVLERLARPHPAVVTPAREERAVPRQGDGGGGSATSAERSGR